MNGAKKLRELLNKEGMLLAPGAFDCITARLIEQAGFEAIYMTGAGTSASRLGFPDYGLATMTEMVENAGRIAAAVQIPLVADADTGYGNELNVIRTVHEYESRNVAGIHIEDQEFPKKCGHLDNKEVIPMPEFISKIRAAAHERRNPDFLIIARTDARAVIGFEEAVQRANAALEAGADMAFVEAPQTIEEIKEIPKRVNGPCLLNVVQGGKTPQINLKEAEQFGYKLAILPGVLLAATVLACDDALEQIKTTHAHPTFSKNITIREKFRRFGSDEWDELRSRYKEN
ncbi:isocitrate lyase/PEP mutase family protein [Effusibacillus dendaii]|uniref:Methylisocitrate lyase n=1 Tax=Effusibacillus dendaii TaxID=2743772 RepID=A0A7I8DB11_9BACL|nr:isocitrate lyase/PEP mutase family protein [Effusibacillus dendaii]BCJ86149.1 methylisocitrate lyase [Effusibacillus dendaii]